MDQSRERFWFSSKSEVTGYDFVDHPIGDAMERRLVADETFNGQFLDASDNAILAFIAKRHSESINEIGLFVHTPDRCWTEGGWKIQPIQPDYVEVEVQAEAVVDAAVTPAVDHEPTSSDAPVGIPGVMISRDVPALYSSMGIDGLPGTIEGLPGTLPGMNP